jgi:MoaA/NifB/PqqE/SkfB family radical SAM enzyme
VPVSLRQKVKVGAYVMRQRLAGRKRYPLVLMLEPLFRCNLACFGCGKIDYPDAILNKRLSVQDVSTRSTNAVHRWWRSRAASR